MNTQPEHTPGPWALTPLRVKGKVIGWGVNGVDSPGDTLTSGRIVDVMVSVPNHDTATQEANARLIASAPDLLEALQRILEQIQETGTVNAHEGQRALAAISKATGTKL